MAKSTNKASIVISDNKNLVFVLIAAIFMLFFGLVIFNQQRAISKLSAESPKAANTNKEAATVLSKVSKLYLLPETEKPIIFTLSSTSDLSKQPAFYKNAHDGDVVLIYKDTQKGIIYRPSSDVLINVGDVTLDTTGG